MIKTNMFGMNSMFRMNSMLVLFGLVAYGCSDSKSVESSLEVESAGGVMHLSNEGTRVSEGYHSIVPDVDGFQATRGALIYLLDTSGNSMSLGFHSLRRLDDACNSDYKVTLGGCRYITTADGSYIVVTDTITPDGSVRSPNNDVCLAKVVLKCSEEQQDI